MKGEIILLQETHTTVNVVKEFERIAKGATLKFSHGTSGARGVLIYVSASLEFEEIKTITDDEGRLIIMKCKIQGQTFLIVNAYGPNDEKAHFEFMQKLSRKIDEINCVNTQFYIMEADWNFVEELTLDRKGGNPKIWKNSCEKMKELRDTYDLTDIWRIRNENTQKFTWWNLS